VFDPQKRHNFCCGSCCLITFAGKLVPSHPFISSQLYFYRKQNGRNVLVQARVVSGVRTEILHGNTFVGAAVAESHCFCRAPLVRRSEAAFTNLDVPLPIPPYHIHILVFRSG
jgi:hypothetical protein